MSRYLMLPIFLFLAACNGFYENIQPVDDLPIDQVYRTVSDLETALNGVYNILQREGLGNLNLLLIPELLADNGDFANTGFPEELDIANQTMRSSNIRAEQTWLAAYEAINQVNVILATLPNITDVALTPEKGNRIQGEALFIRGWLHFELVRYYGQLPGDTSPEGGVPIMTQAVFKKDDLTFPARASVQAVYDQAASDLSQAKDLLVGTGLEPDRANARAAQAILARIAFHLEDYQQAALQVQSLIDEVPFDPNTTPQSIFNETAGEILWVIAFSPTDNSIGKRWFHESVGLISITEELRDAFEKIVPASRQLAAAAAGFRIVDLRVDPGLLTSAPMISADTAYTNKYEDINSFADDTPMARMAEFVLMQAEILGRSGNLEESIALLNQIRERSLRVIDVDGVEQTNRKELILYTMEDFRDAADLIEAIVLERRVELCFEGNYFHDVIRLKRTVDGTSYNDCRLRLPIPQRERDVNPNLTDECY